MDTKREERLLSLDTLRGFDMLFIMGFASWVVALNRCCPTEVGEWLAGQMSHTVWDGFTQHDLIFPLFLFIAGISFPFSLAKQRSRGMPDRRIGLRVLRRGVTLVVLGLVYNGVTGFFSDILSYVRLMALMLSGSIIAAPGMIAEAPGMDAITSAWLPILYAGAFSCGIAYTLQVVGQRYVRPSHAVLLLSLESVWAAIGGALLLSERMSVRESVGCALVFAAVIAAQLPSRKKER